MACMVLCFVVINCFCSVFACLFICWLFCFLFILSLLDCYGLISFCDIPCCVKSLVFSDPSVSSLFAARYCCTQTWSYWCHSCVELEHTMDEKA